MKKQVQLTVGTGVNFTATPTNGMAMFAYSSKLILFFFIFPFVHNIYAQGTCLSYNNSDINVNQRTILSNSATLQKETPQYFSGLEFHLQNQPVRVQNRPFYL